MGVADEVPRVGLHRRVGVCDGITCGVQGGFELVVAGVLALGFGQGFTGVMHVLGEVGVAGLLGELRGQVEIARAASRASKRLARVSAAVIAGSRFTPSLTWSLWMATQMGLVVLVAVVDDRFVEHGPGRSHR